MENTINVSLNTEILEGDTDVPLPSSKSISNRLLLMQHIAGKNFKLKNISISDDTVLMQELLEKIVDNEDSDEEVELNVNNAGTVMRFLTALLSFTDGEWLLTGNERMKSRPISPLVSALRSLGANIEYTEKQDYPPLRIVGNSEICKTQNAVAEIDAGVSSQFVSALMMIAPLFSTGLHISMICANKVSVPYIQMTASLMRSCGVRVEFIDNNNIFAEGRYTAPEHLYVESDWSSASYLYAILALSEHGGTLRLPHLYEDSVQGDKILAEWFEDFGIETLFNEDGVIITSAGSAGISRAPRFYDFTHHPDIAQTIAVVCAGLGLEATISGIHSLRHKETDRISAVCNELTRLGAKLEYNSEDDEMHIFEGGFNGGIKNQVVHTYGDHRMAMAFASLAARYAPVSIENPSVVSKSFPNFWSLFNENL